MHLCISQSLASLGAAVLCQESSPVLNIAVQARYGGRDFGGRDFMDLGLFLASLRGKSERSLISLPIHCFSSWTI